MTYIPIIKLLLVIIGVIAALRVPYLLLFAEYVTGYEWSEMYHRVVLMEIGRGTEAFWRQCIPKVIIKALIAAACYWIFSII